MLLSIILVWCAAVFLFMAAVMVAIPVDNPFGRFALVLVGVALLALAIYMLLLLRTNIIRIEVDSQHVKIRTPRLRGALPLFSTVRAEIPLADVASVETREEVYSSFGMTTVQRSYRIVTRDGAGILLGIMAENWGSQMPYDKAAQEIASRAHLPITDHGAVRVGGVIRAMIHDVPPWTADAMTPEESTRLHRRATLTIQFIMLLVVGTALLRACVGS